MASFNHAIVYISVFEYSLFGLFLLLSGHGKILSNKIFAVFLFSKALCYVQTSFWQHREFAVIHIPYLFYIGPGFDLLLGPALFYYVKSLMDENLKFTKRDLVHLMAFALYFLVMFILFHRFDADTKTRMLIHNFLGRTGYYLHNFLVYSPFIFYSGACIIKIRKYRRQAKDHYASIHRKKVLWLQSLVTGLMLIWTLAVIKLGCKYLGVVPPIPSSFIIIVIFIFANAIFFTGFSAQEIFLPIPEAQAPPEKYLKTPMDETRRDDILQRILSFMEEEKPYMDPEFNLQKLSGQTGIKPHRISQVINTGLKKNFYDMVNGYRIEESKRLLEKNAVATELKASDKKTVLEILYESGFNSKSAFHRAFKKHTGMTPTLFSRSIQK